MLFRSRKVDTGSRRGSARTPVGRHLHSLCFYRACTRRVRHAFVSIASPRRLKSQASVKKAAQSLSRAPQGARFTHTQDPPWPPYLHNRARARSCSAPPVLAVVSAASFDPHSARRRAPRAPSSTSKTFLRRCISISVSIAVRVVVCGRDPALSSHVPILVSSKRCVTCREPRVVWRAPRVPPIIQQAHKSMSHPPFSPSASSRPPFHVLLFDHISCCPHRLA